MFKLTHKERKISGEKINLKHLSDENKENILPVVQSAQMIETCDVLPADL